MQYLINESNIPGYNLAFEEYCFKNLPRGEKYIFFWINKPAIIVGKNQNTIEEINEKFVEDNNIEVVRRITGGGAVYHDYGNLNFTIITEEDSNSRIDFEKYNQTMIDALKRLNIRADLRGRNDILLDGRKVSGIAQSVSKKRVLNHGTLMFDVDLDILENSLYVKKDKLKSKGIKSVRSRVANIKEYLNQDMNIGEFKDFLLEALFDIEGEDPERYILSKEELSHIECLYKEKYSKWYWNFGRSPRAEFKNYKKFKSGSIEISFDIIGGYIRNTKIHGDFFGSKDIGEVEELLEGCKYIRSEIETGIKDINLDDYFGKLDNKKFIDLIFEES